MNNSSDQSYFFAGASVMLVAVVLAVNEFTITSWVSFGGTLRVFDRVIIWIFDLFFLGCAWVLFRRRHILHVGRAEALLLIGTFFFMLFAAEGGARIIDAAHGHDFLQNKQRAERGIIPFRMFGPSLYAEENGVRYIIDRHGKRYPFAKPNGAFRIIAFGGSTTQQLVDGVHYPSRLEELLQEQYPDRDIEVINVGNSSYSTPHFLILLALDVITWDPDLLIASENVNDLTVAYFPHFALDYANKYTHKMFLPRPSLSHMMWGWSRLYWIFRSRWEAFMYRMAETRDVQYQRTSYGENPPEESSSVFRRNWESFLMLANARGVPVILASQPLEISEAYWDLHMRYKPYNDVVVYPEHHEFVLHHAAYNEIIKNVARDQGAYFLDNALLFGGRRELFSDFVHYSRSGIEELAHNYALFIQEHNLIR